MAQVDFPYGKKRNWEFDTADADIGLKSVPDSLVLSHSLRQSRDKWLYHTFRKFTSKARGAKAPEPPPPHTIMSRGKCDIIVGPHHFRQTNFYEVHYMQPASAAPTYQPPSTTVPASFSAASATQGSSDNQDLSQLRLTLGGGLEYTISSDLVTRIHHEASVNPIFAAKFRLAVDPSASPEQIRNFAFALPHLPGVKVSGAPSSLTLSTEQQVRLPPVREWDLVIEFHETPNERWLIPRGTLASCSRLLSKDNSGLSEVSLVLRLPIPPAASKAGEASPPEPSPDTNPPRPTKFTLRSAPNSVYDLILNWIGGDEKNKENAAALAKIPKRQKVYIAHRIPQGALLTQLQAAQTPGYTMRPLKQGPSNPRPRRKAAQKPKPKPTLQETPVPSGTSTEAIHGVPVPVLSPVQTQKPTKPPKEAKEPKRRRYQSVAKPSPIIRCTVCFKTDVPLMKGGRFCRECVESGKADDAIPQLPQKPSLSSYNSTSYAFATGPAAVVPATASQANSQPQSAANAPVNTSVAAAPTATSIVPSPTSHSPTPLRDTPAIVPADTENTTNAHTPSAPSST